MQAIRRILVPSDVGPASTAAPAYARDLARATGARLYLLHIVDAIAARFIDFPFGRIGQAQTSMEASARKQLDDLLSHEDRRFPQPQTAILTARAPANAIVGYARDEHIDLIVMGTHGRAPVVRRFLGAVADRVVRTAPCPVLTVREPKPEAMRAEPTERSPAEVAVRQAADDRRQGRVT